MRSSRRDFLKTAGFAVLGLGGAATTSILPSLLLAELGENPARRAQPALVIDLEKCKRRCDDCVRACHFAHRVPNMHSYGDQPLPEDEAGEEEIKWIWQEKFEDVFADRVHKDTDVALRERKVPVLCNHCGEYGVHNPPCVRVCPTQATFKRVDGIVVIDQHRCIGCRYCIVACPYGSRSFNWRSPRPAIDWAAADDPFVQGLDRSYRTRMRGVVEKCNFCADLRQPGGAGLWEPVCVKACREKARAAAMVFGRLGDDRILDLIKSGRTIRRRPGLGTEPHVYYLV